MTWDSAADFLLGLGYENLYERADARPCAFGPFRCIGCRALVAPADRKAHHTAHVSEQTRRRAVATERARREALVKARRARKEKASV